LLQEQKGEHRKKGKERKEKDASKKGQKKERK
jgi:hypothetical protein